MGRTRRKNAIGPTILTAAASGAALVALFVVWVVASSGSEAKRAMALAGPQHDVVRNAKVDRGLQFGSMDLEDALHAKAALVRRSHNTLVMSFAAVPSASESPFEALFVKAPTALDVLDQGPINAPSDAALVLSGSASGEMNCLAQAVYFEARGESHAGQLAVAQVVLNRVRSARYPDTICGVVYQNEHKYNRCQFSFACDGRSETASNRRSWNDAVSVAQDAVAGERKDLIAGLSGNTLYYHATSVSPRWASQMRVTKRIGRHIFYERRS